MKKLPITPTEFLEIFKESKMILIPGNLDLDAYFVKITDLINNGFSKTKIIEELYK